MSIYLLYNKRSCVTGKQIFDEMKGRLKGLSFRRIMNKEPAKKPSLIVRWGSSSFNFNCEEINSKEAVNNASNKLEMMKILSKTEGVEIPEISFDSSNYKHLLDTDGLAYFRNANDQIRYRSSWVAGDKYCVKTLDKAHEYRVHIFKNSTVGIYEKIPESANVKIFKNDNCTFRRIDMSLESSRKALNGVRPMAKIAVEALGLTFGGVDVVLSSNGSVRILEVNSSPALNSLNIGRFCDLLEEEIKTKLNIS
jgi:hypothetical protein